MAFDTQKNKLLLTILKENDFKSVIIFASTKEKVKKLNTDLQRAKTNSKAFHSDLDQKEREEILREFKNKSLPILVGTDIISRGIDVEGIELVINYDVPNDPEDYIHRIGRTARAATTGIAITFINDKDQQKFASIESMIGRIIDKKPIPIELGEAPAYEPDVKPKNKNFSGKKPFKKKFKKKTIDSSVKNA
jgi:superfamily II DNA/RNA helicase